MKSNFTWLIVFAIFGICNFMNAQTLMGGGEYKFNESKTPCLTDEQREAVMSELKNGIQELSQQNTLAYDATNRGAHPLFSWPIKKRNGLAYNDVWGISNYVDQNPAFPNQLLDYNCGAVTYDTTGGYNHAGIDVFTWPFSWKMMDNNDVEIIAAAAGQIIYKASTNTDRSCSLSGGNWNAVYIQHADGSAALYGHMKQNSLTTKNVGEMVSEGEFLGIVGSSGNSTGPHLHFEAYSEIEWNGTGTDVLIDPYAGSCNSLNTDSWWQNQKPYKNPNINAVMTHSAPPVFPTCPTQEVTNESNDFNANASVYFGLYMRDQAAGTSVNLKITRPDNSILYNWNFDFTDNYAASYWYWSYSGVYNMNGQWKWEGTYQGQTVTHTFNITGALGVDDEDFNSTSIYPNPVKDMVTITSNSKVEKATITDMMGKTIRIINTNAVEGIKEINLETLSNGIYFLNLQGNLNHRKIIKLVKE
ncbi:MAG: peptidoglycan DD-metalloendopeptidase family protein [Aquaticitalea sp.]